MLFTSVTYRRIKNLGNFESETIEMTAEIQAGDSWIEVTDTLKESVLFALDIEEPIKKKPSEEF